MQVVKTNLALEMNTTQRTEIMQTVAGRLSLDIDRETNNRRAVYAPFRLKPLMRHQVAPLLGRQFGHRHTPDPEPFHRQHLQPDTLACMRDLAGLHPLEGEAQPGFVLPAD